MKATRTGGGIEVMLPVMRSVFPRLARFRDDKRPEDATTLSEAQNHLFKAQGTAK
jgi:hypothetical protein